MSSVILAGKVDELGDSFIKTLTDWGSAGLGAALIILVLVTIGSKWSMKAAIGALLAMVIALGIYKSRDALSDMVSDEINHPANAAAVVVDGRSEHAGGVL
ncbi:hypothetical protein [Streptomyces sp. NBC_01565]|uniref:hypothetical protein n=1 Tax=unclassified Streptomyces TaxID=2593676 RepID=UPI00224E0B46|nr:hypothetical protein [Streptomyces sp. NBC_01565]MCX4546895.1 hypothetical protein [Streptomyces sp. NBC_01565]